MEYAWTVVTDAEREYKRYILDFMHILKFFESVTDEWVADKTKILWPSIISPARKKSK